MRKKQLDRLSKLTTGAALLGASVFASACNNEPHAVNGPDPRGTEPIHVNATATPTTVETPPSASGATSAAPSSSAKPLPTAPVVPHHTNG